MTTTELSKLLALSVTPFHATKILKQYLVSAGFNALREEDSWELTPHGKYFVVRNDSSIIAFTYPSQAKIEAGFHMVGAHTDSPALKIKPHADLKRHGVKQLGVEPYGGMLYNPWFDRNLSIAGVVYFSKSDGSMGSKLVDFKRPIGMIPSLAIHLDKEANSKRSVNAQEHLPVVIGLDNDKSFYDLLHEELGEADIEILSHELFLYDVAPPLLYGEGEVFLSAARLDNLLSCFCAVDALAHSDVNEASLLVCSDHEEVGSQSAQGAHSNFLELVLKRLAPKSEQFARMMHKSVLISTDNAHAIHPNYSEVHEKEHAPKMAQGVVVKYNANQAYATNAKGDALIKKYAQNAKLPLQSYVVRSDMRCGSTIGPITATKLGVTTVDIGVPTWAMHSIRETAAVKDIEDLNHLLRYYFDRHEDHQSKVPHDFHL